MRKELLAIAGIAALGMATAAQAAPVTIDFEEIAAAGTFTTLNPGDSINNDDARLDVISGSLTVVSDTHPAVTGGATVDNDSDWAVDLGTGSFRLSTGSGAAFDLLSFDLGDFDNPLGGGGNVIVDLLITPLAGVQFLHTVTVTSPVGFVTQTFAAGFTGLQSVLFSTSSSSVTAPAFDNIMIDIAEASGGAGQSSAGGGEDGGSGVPSPGALAILGFGLVGFRAMKVKTA